MFNKICRTIGVPPMYCYLFVFILICVSVFLIQKYLLNNHEGMDSGKKSIVYCYMNGCGHCKNFDPIWDQFMNGSKLPTLSYAKIEASEDPEFMDKMDVRGFPTVIAVDSDGTKIKEHDGARTVDALNDFADEIANDK